MTTHHPPRKKVVERGMVISLEESGKRGLVSLYGKGVHEFSLSCWKGEEEKPPARGDTVEVTFKEGTLIRVEWVKKTIQDLLRSLTPEELAAVPRLSKERIREAFRKGAEERLRESQASRRMPLETKRPSLLERVKGLEQKVDRLEKLVVELSLQLATHRPLLPPKSEFLTPEQAIVDDEGT